MNTPKLPDIIIDAQNLYREEVITDRKTGVLRVLTPMTAQGTADTSREVIYMGEAQLMTSIGALPVPFEIPGKTLAEVTQNFSAAAKDAIEKTLREIQDLRRQAASSLVIPPSGANLSGGGLAGLGGDALPGGGKIRMP